MSKIAVTLFTVVLLITTGLFSYKYIISSKGKSQLTKELIKQTYGNQFKLERNENDEPAVVQGIIEKYEDHILNINYEKGNIDVSVTVKSEIIQQKLEGEMIKTFLVDNLYTDFSQLDTILKEDSLVTVYLENIREEEIPHVKRMFIFKKEDIPLN